MRFALTDLTVFVLSIISSCQTPGQQDPYHYFARLQQLRLTIMSEYKQYAMQGEQTPGARKEMMMRFLRAEDSVRNCTFSQNDFGLKNAILNEFSYSIQLFTDSTFEARSRDTALSIEERAKALDAIAAELDRKTKSINKQVLKSQLAFARFYRIPVTTP